MGCQENFFLVLHFSIKRARAEEELGEFTAYRRQGMGVGRSEAIMVGDGLVAPVLLRVAPLPTRKQRGGYLGCHVSRKGSGLARRNPSGFLLFRLLLFPAFECPQVISLCSTN